MRAKKTLLVLGLFTLPLFNLTSCVSESSLAKRKIDPSTLKMFNFGSSGFETFSKPNSWTGGQCMINDALTQPLVYLDRFFQPQGGLLIDQEDNSKKQPNSKW